MSFANMKHFVSYSFFLNLFALSSKTINYILQKLSVSIDVILCNNLCNNVVSTLYTSYTYLFLYHCIKNKTHYPVFNVNMKIYKYF